MFEEKEKIDKKERVVINRYLEKLIGFFYFWVKGVEVKKLNGKLGILDWLLDWMWKFKKYIDK